ncbi:hypothetical protein [Bradyrhizobium sp. SZCCHNRI1009]|uniref:hypothetical protein n=1 Tax=Bradyrhizobium sp. SZCCHNRI1009 TaxID=3057277 RepID=UPI0029169D5F|nr:hypothetical protein [Bradyrhizobium sp. SZCCHNRI1009]
MAAIVAPSDEAPARAATALEYALDSAGSQGRLAFEQILQAILTDAALLDQRFSAVTLANSKLWPGELPDWLQELWEELKQRLIAENEGWEVWTRWYEHRLSGQHSSDQIELRWATISDDAWEHELGTVNRALAALTDTGESTPKQASVERTDAQPSQPGLLGVQAVGQAGSIGGQVSITATAEFIPDPAIEAVVSRIKSDPRTFEDIARFAARSIETELNQLATKIPNEPTALAGYEEVRAVLQRLQSGFEELAVAVHASAKMADPVEQTNLLRRAVRAARSITEGFVGWLDDNGTAAGRVIAELGLAGVIAGTLSYYVGVPPLVSFSVTAAALKGKSIWDAIVLLAPQKKGGEKGD